MQQEQIRDASRRRALVGARRSDRATSASSARARAACRSRLRRRPSAARRADREAQDGRRLPQLRLRALQGADRGGQARAPCARRATFGISARRSRRSTHGAVHDHVQRRDRRHRAQQLGRALHRPRRAGHHGGRAASSPRDTVVAGDYRIKARRFVIATGSSPAVPPIPGLDDVPYFTNETDLRQRRASSTT